ncbi:MAG TPA: hypothetical protein VF401_03430 [Candidatus Saccharimonadales bacterium]
MDKRQLHHLWTKIRAVKPVYLLIVTLLLAVICVFSLRANNQHMVKLRNAVYTADQNDGDVQGALKALQAYVTRHMNTNLSAGPNAVYPPIQLKYTYERLQKAQGDSASAANSQIYTDAQHACEAQDSTDFSGRNRVPCIEAYVTSHGGKVITPIPEDLYKFSFASPRWSPDLAGWSLVATIFSALTCVLVFIIDKWFKKNV